MQGDGTSSLQGFIKAKIKAFGRVLAPPFAAGRPDIALHSGTAYSLRGSVL
ncbi:hypothetical protein T02_16216 [Trichinella nativa]|uniref:Uncharacterized protein n=1 Tax=Trichinella nativa TaxID=6335 RepID=A0A0V1LM83_9BILA|nr:hypothetical protein T02_16216 [Trichinella nativa]